jgi:hypothetical protein
LTNNYLKLPPVARIAGPAGPTTSPKPGGAAEKPAPAKAVNLRIPEQERRRGQRVLLRIRTQIHVAAEGVPTTMDAMTLSVNPRGALVVLKKNLPPETRLVLEHSGTRERVACKVVRPPREMPEGFHTPLEFDAPAPDFWKIAFPPADWRAEDL